MVHARVEVERDELAGKLDKLRTLLAGKQPEFISDRQWSLLFMQEKAMALYLNILDERLGNWNMEKQEEIDTEESEEIWEPTEWDLKLRRYGFLFGKLKLSPEEQTEKEHLRQYLRDVGKDPGWEV